MRWEIANSSHGYGFTEQSFNRAQRYDPKTVVSVFSVDLRARNTPHDLCHRQCRVRRRTAKLYSIVSSLLVVLERTMQERSVGGIDADFERLEPVARDMSLERKGAGVGRDKTVKACKRGWLAGATDRRTGCRCVREPGKLCAESWCTACCPPAPPAPQDLPPTSNNHPWNAQRSPPFSSRPKARSAPRCGQARWTDRSGPARHERGRGSDRGAGPF